MNGYQKSEDSELGLANLYGILGGLYFGPSAPLDSLRLVQSLETDKFLELLNRKETQAKPILLRPMKLLRPTLTTATTPQVSYVPPPTVSQILRGWVDDWLDSGREDGGDFPEKRTFDRARIAAVEAYKFSERGNLRLVSRGQTLVPWLETKEEPNKFEFLLEAKRESFARQQLVFMLLSDLRFKLAKCRYEKCGTYFELKHWKRAYRKGTLCDSCGRSRSLESAKSATALERKMAKERLYKLAAKRFAKPISKNPNWYGDAKLKASIAEFLSVKIKASESLRAVYPKGIQGKWVANVKNWKPIELAAKGGN